MTAPGQRQAGRRGQRRRLSRSSEFDRVFRQGRSFGTRHLVLHAFPRPGAEGAATPDPDARAPRLGVSVGRRVGGAVERNRVKRLLRESFWALAPSLPASHDFVLVARPEARELADAGGEQAFERALRDLIDQSGLAR